MAYPPSPRHRHSHALASNSAFCVVLQQLQADCEIALEHVTERDYNSRYEHSGYPPGVHEEAIEAGDVSMAQAVAFYTTNRARYDPNAAATSSKRARSAPKWPAWAIIEDEVGERYRFPHGAVLHPVDGRYYMCSPNAEGCSQD